MGAWGPGIFENDTACDWAYGLEGLKDLSLVESALDAVLEAAGGECLEAPQAEEALAAAEVIARLQGNWGVKDPYTEAMDRWVQKVKLAPGPELARKALASIQRILSAPSELLELWEESEDFEAWKKSVEDLKARIRA